MIEETERGPQPLAPLLLQLVQGIGNPEEIRAGMAESAVAGRLDPLAELTCRPCRDTGWRTRNLMPGEPGFGELVECTCPAGSAIRQRRQDRVWQAAGIPPKFAKYTLETLAKRPGKALLAERLGEWRRTRHWLLLTGRPGTCKSGAAAALLSAHQAEGGQGLFVLLNRLLDRLQATFGARDDQPGYLEAFETLVAAELLVLDDVGANGKPLSAWGQEQVFKLIDARDLAERQTILTTNLPAAGKSTELLRYVGEPTWDRIRGRVGRWVVETTGTSQRGMDL